MTKQLMSSDAAALIEVSALYDKGTNRLPLRSVNELQQGVCDE